MKRELFSDFLRGGDALRVYRQGELVFTSDKPGVLPLLEYAARFAPHEKDVTVFDRVVGNAAALLLSKISCRQVYSPLGSDLARKTLHRYSINYHFTETVPFIQNQAGEDMCPMERLSLGKDPEEFYQACLSLGLGDKP